jgi:hypothetical protein
MWTGCHAGPLVGLGRPPDHSTNISSLGISPLVAFERTTPVRGCVMMPHHATLTRFSTFPRDHSSSPCGKDLNPPLPSASSKRHVETNQATAASPRNVCCPPAQGASLLKPKWLTISNPTTRPRIERWPTSKTLPDWPMQDRPAAQRFHRPMKAVGSAHPSIVVTQILAKQRRSTGGCDAPVPILPSSPP